MAVPPLYKFLIQSVPDACKVPFHPNGKANRLIIDGMSLLSMLYPPPLDWVLPPWKELHSRVQLFVHRLTSLGFQPVVFFSATKGEQQNVEAKKRLVSDRSRFVQYVLHAIESGAQLPEDVYYTSVRLIKSTLVKAFQSCDAVQVVVTAMETARAMALYCVGKEEEIFAMVGTDLSESLMLPIPALCSIHAGVFDWEAFWRGAPPDVLVIKRAQVSDALVPQFALPVFATLVGNPLFPRDRLQGFFTNESHPDEIFSTARNFILGAIKEDPEPSFEGFAGQVYADLTTMLDYGTFVTDFTNSCAAYTLNEGDQLTETHLDMVQKSRFYFFEPGFEFADANPAILLLRPLRLRALHLKFGAMTFAEVWAQPGGLCSTDYLSLPTSSQTEEQVMQKPLLERLQLFETLSNVELGPIMVFNENYELSQPSINEGWLYLTAVCMSQLEGRSSFIRRDELQWLVAQFVCLADTETHLLPQGTLTLERASLCHLFHSTISHLSKLNVVCGSPFKPYNEWEMFDGTVAALDLDALFALPAFIKNKERYERLVDMIEANLAQPLLDEPTPVPSEAQRRRFRGKVTPAAQLRVAPPPRPSPSLDATLLHDDDGKAEARTPNGYNGVVTTPTKNNGPTLQMVTNPILLDSAIKAISPHVERRASPSAASRKAFFSDPALAAHPLCEEVWPDLNSSRSPNAKRDKAATGNTPPKSKPSVPDAAPRAPGAHSPSKGSPGNAKSSPTARSKPVLDHEHANRFEARDSPTKAEKAEKAATTPTRKWVPKVQ